MKKIKNGDILLITLTATSDPKPHDIERGWLLVTEVSVNGDVTTGNFMAYSNAPAGYGQVLWPKFILHALIRGRHGQRSPFAAITKLFGKSSADVLTRQRCCVVRTD